MEIYIGIATGLLLGVCIQRIYLLGYKRGFKKCKDENSEDFKQLNNIIDDLLVKVNQPVKQTEDDEEIEQILALFDYQQGDFKKDKGGKQK